jgi:hypothetical protein
MSYEYFTAGLVALALATTACGGDDSGGDTTFGNTTAPTSTTDPTAGDETAAVMTDDGSDGSGSGGMPVCNATPSTSFATDIQPILAANCVDDCHEASGFWPSFLLEGDAASNYDAIVGEPGLTQPLPGSGVNLIEPCDPDNSYMFAKILGMGESLGAVPGLQAMPLECTMVNAGNPAICDTYVEIPLAQADIDLIETWILDGAPE